MYSTKFVRKKLKKKRYKKNNIYDNLRLLGVNYSTEITF